MRQGLAANRDTGLKVFQTRLLGQLAEACALGGQVEEGLSTLREAFEAVTQTGEREYEVELCRLKGELLLRAGGQSPETRSRRAGKNGG
jgi:hypothetical protein